MYVNHARQVNVEAREADHEALTLALNALPKPTPCYDDDRFLSDSDTIQTLAALRCAGCPLLDRCRTYGLAWPEELGVYGGLTQKERQAAAPTPRPPSPPPAKPRRERPTPDPQRLAARRAHRERLAAMTPAERKADRAEFNRWRQSRYRFGLSATRAEYDTPTPHPTSTQPREGAHTRKDR